MQSWMQNYVQSTTHCSINFQINYYGNGLNSIGEILIKIDMVPTAYAISKID